MGDITNPRILYLKGFLFFLGCILSSVAIFLERPSLRIVAFIMVALWCSARFYYFMFYVIEKYIGEDYKFAGVSSFILHLVKKNRGRPG